MTAVWSLTKVRPGGGHRRLLGRHIGGAAKNLSLFSRANQHPPQLGRGTQAPKRSTLPPHWRFRGQVTRIYTPPTARPDHHPRCIRWSITSRHHQSCFGAGFKQHSAPKLQLRITPLGSETFLHRRITFRPDLPEKKRVAAVDEPPTRRCTHRSLRSSKGGGSSSLLLFLSS